jgi:hypothetical protein
MDLKQGSKISLLIQLQANHALAYSAANLWTLSPPSALANDPEGFDTKIKLTATGTNPTYKDYRSFKYNRVDLAVLGASAGTAQTNVLTGAARVYDCFPYILKTFGVLFDADDVEDAALIDNGDGTFKIPLTAKSTGIFWKGSCTLFSGGIPSISAAIPEPYFDWS